MLSHSFLLFEVYIATEIYFWRNKVLMKSSSAKSPRYVVSQIILILVVLTLNTPDSLGLDTETLAQ